MAGRRVTSIAAEVLATASSEARLSAIAVQAPARMPEARKINRLSDDRRAVRSKGASSGGVNRERTVPLRYGPSSSAVRLQ